MRRRTTAWVVVLASVPAVAHADTITLDEALRRAGERPTVAIARSDEDAARAEVRGARLYTYNPELALAVGPRRLAGENTYAFEVSLAQTIELGGKRSARTDAAEARAKVASAGVALETLGARLEAWRAYELGLVARARLETAKETEQLAVSIATATRERLAAGAGTQLELNVTTAEAGRATHDRLDAENEYEAVLGELATAVGASAGERLEPEGSAIAPPALSWTEDDFVAKALKSRPDLTATRASVDAARAEARLDDALATPDLTVGLSYGYERDLDVTTQSLVVTASIPLPLWNRNQGARAAARSRVKHAEIDDARIRVEVEREARLTFGRFARARDAVLGFDQEVVGKLDENLTLARDSLTSGKIDYFEFSQVRRDLVASRIAYLDAIAEAVEARFAALSAVGEATP